MLLLQREEFVIVCLMVELRGKVLSFTQVRTSGSYQSVLAFSHVETFPPPVMSVSEQKVRMKSVSVFWSRAVMFQPALNK